MINPTPKFSLAPPRVGYRYTYHTTIKPVGAKCNLSCQYCFYLSKQSLLSQNSHSVMDDEVLEQHIKQYIESQTGGRVIFTWQGGEPTLAGLVFFKKVICFQEKYAASGQQIFNDLQTNAVLLTDEWYPFLKQHHFLLGISIDGPEALHNKYRVYRNGHGTYDRVMRNLEKIKEYQIPFNILCVVNNHNVQFPLEIYHFFRDTVRPLAIQFLPAVETTGYETVAPNTWEINLDSALPSMKTTSWSVPALAWGQFLVTIWNDWIKYDLGNVFVDNFENAIGQVLGYPALNCITHEFCGKALAIEYSGDLYSCDRYVYPEYHLGNIQNIHEGNMAFSKQQQSFGFDKKRTLTTYCQKCPHLSICWGECPKNRFIYTPDNELGLNYLCQGLKLFYEKVKSDIHKIKPVGS